MFEVAHNSTPTPLAAEAEHAQGRQSSDLLSPPQSPSGLFNLLIPWDSSCE